MKESLNVNAQSYNGCTALQMAVMEDLDEISFLLIKNGADSTLLNYVNHSSSSDCEESDKCVNDQEEVMRGNKNNVKDLFECKGESTSGLPHLTYLLTQGNVEVHIMRKNGNIYY